MSRPGASVTNVSPGKQHISCKDKRNKTSETLIKGKESIQQPDNPSKRAKEDSIPDEKNLIKNHLQHLKTRKTILAVLMRRHVNPMILQVKLMVV